MLLFMSFAMIACGREDRRGNSSGGNKDNKGSALWSSSEIKEKVNECVEEGESPEKCACMVKKVSERMTYSEFSLARRILDAIDGPSNPSVSDSDRKMILKSFNVASSAATECINRE